MKELFDLLHKKVAGLLATREKSFVWIKHEMHTTPRLDDDYLLTEQEIVAKQKKKIIEFHRIGSRIFEIAIKTDELSCWLLSSFPKHLPRKNFFIADSDRRAEKHRKKT